jgi:hypothetical protein
MNKALVSVLILVALIAYGIWFEFFHPLSYSKYRAWVADCLAQPEGAKRGSSSPVPDCAVSYGDWQNWVDQTAAAADQRRP